MRASVRVAVTVFLGLCFALLVVLGYIAFFRGDFCGPAYTGTRVHVSSHAYGVCK